MSLDKAIEHHKEYRKEYYGSKAIDPSCRCHGGGVIGAWQTGCINIGKNNFR